MLSSGLALGTAELMRILVADQNAMLLAAVASTFGRHCVIVTATRRESCLEHLTNDRFDVVVACERLRDYTGLELLSEVETLSPHTLRIFAAPAAQLARLGPRLDHFRLFGTLSYPLEPRKLLLALKVARTKLPPRPKVRHVVLDSEWDTGERLGLLEQELEVEPAAPPTLAAASPEEAIPAAPPERSIPVARVAAPVARAIAAPTTAPAAAQEPDDIPVVADLEEISVSQVRRVREPPPAEASFEVSFDENPNHSGAKPPQGTPPKPKRTRPGTQKAAGAPASGNTAQGSGAQRSTGAPAGRGGHTGGNHTASSVQAPPPQEPLPALPVDTDLAANDPAFETEGGEKTVARSGPQTATTAKTQRTPAARKTVVTGPQTTATAKMLSAPPARQTDRTGPQPRRPAVPTAAQREAFQRAVARRNAARLGLSERGLSAPGSSSQANSPQASDASGSFRPHWHGTHSLSDLARMATGKRPLTHGNPSLLPKRKVFVVGSGIAAVLLASVLAFELTGSHAPTHHNRRAVAAQLFSPNSSLVAENNTTESSPQVFGPAPARPAEGSTPSSISNLPQPEVFDPNTAPEDPPPPPALERPGPMEPPSMGHSEPPLGMQDGGTE
jgi:CheY-like chemotaxis protein